MMIGDDMPLLSWRAAPTASGPRAESCDEDPAVNRLPRDYVTEWSAFVIKRPDIARWIELRALSLAADGARRIETDSLFRQARGAFGRGLNHNHRRACALWLITRTPALATLIELRK